MKIGLFAFYVLFLILFSCASEKQEPISSVSKEEISDDEIKPVPYLQIDSCLKYSAERLYDLSMEYYGKEMLDNGFTSLAGEDAFHSHYAFILYDYMNEKFPGHDSIRVELFRLMNEVNDFFSCAGGGGTLYGHMEAKISARIEEMMLMGMKMEYKMDVNFKEEDWKDRLKDIVDISYGGNPDEVMKKCFRQFTFKDSAYKGWIMYVVYTYMGDYNFGP